jgi:hypothetical protein
MKNITLIVCFELICLWGTAQSLESENKVLTVERDRKNNKVTYNFKPGKKLYIETSGGFKLSIKNYLLLDNAMILSEVDTVFFSEITRIRGRVYVKKGAGVLVSVLSIPAAGMGGFITDWSSVNSPVVGALPFAGTFFVGIRMITGKNDFNTSDKWVITVSQNKSGKR